MSQTQILQISEKEKERLSRLEYYDILDTSYEPQFDDLTKLVTKMLDVPICIITIIDDYRVWFKSKNGLKINQISREFSFCNTTINQGTFTEMKYLKNRQGNGDFQTAMSNLKIDYYAGVPLIDQTGVTIGTFCILDYKTHSLDVTQIELLETLAKTTMRLIKLRREKMEGEKLAKISDEFLSNMSHEMRTPLNAIIGFNDLLLKTETTTEQLEYLKIVNQASQNMKMLINDILDISKLESKKIILEKRPTCLIEVMNHAIKLQEHSGKSKGLKISSSIDSEIPPFVQADAIRLTQIFVNLLSNAIKFTHNGYVNLKVDLLHKNNKTAKISFIVSDSGVGIEKSKLNTIFERFVQAENHTSQVFEGSGLGLNIVKMLIDLHEGNIFLESEPNQGSKFTVEIDFQISSDDCDVSLVHKKLNENIPDLNGIKVLLVEDNKHNQLLGKKYLTKANMVVELAEDGIVAIEKITNNTFDLILMDLQMPNMNGYECTKYIRAHINSDIPIIGCSAHSLIEEKKKCLAVGMNGFISKPYSEYDLKVSIGKFKKDQAKITTKNFGGLFDALSQKEGDEFAMELIEIFQETTPPVLNQLRFCIQNNTIECIAKEIHFLKGSLGVMGFDSGMEICLAIETCIKSKMFSEMIDLSTQLIHYLEDILEYISSNSIK